MRGPKYVKDDKGERLVTKCRICKYTVESPCADIVAKPAGVVKVQFAEEPIK